jgi:membrane protein
VRPRHAIARVQTFFGARIWSASLTELERGKALLYRLARILYATVQGFLDKHLTFRAAALTYYTVLSIVPALAFAFSVVKGFGGYQRLLDGTIRPFLLQTFGGNPELHKAIEQMLSFVDRTSVTGLGTVGVLLLVYTSINMLSTIEAALNEIWGAKSARPLLRKVTDYTTLMVITPLLILVAVALGSAAASSGVVKFMTGSLGLGDVFQFLVLRFGSLALACIALVALYVIMPNVHVRFRSALFGGLIGGVMWQASLLAYVKFQMGMASYNALYAGFGAVPIFLVWLDVSWTIVLVGAQLAASHQYEQNLRQAIRARNVDQQLREELAVALAADVTLAFLRGQPPRTQAALAEALEIPSPTAEEVLNALVSHDVLLRAVCGHELGYVPARDVDQLRVSDARDAVRRDPQAEELKQVLDSHVGPRLRHLLDAIDEDIRRGASNLTLRQLAGLAATDPPRAPAPAPQAAADGASDVAIVDGKQPAVSS